MKWGLLGLALWLAVSSFGCVTKSRYEEDTKKLKDDIAALEAARADMSDQRDAERLAKESCLRELAAMQGQKGELSEDLQSALRQLDEMRAIAAKRQAVLDKLMNSLKEMASAGKVNVVMRNGMLVVEIAESILFDTGKSKLKPEGEAAITELAPLLAQVNRSFQVAGHTDNVGTAETNWTLSSKRARSVLDQFVAAGYPQERLSLAGFAYFQPVATNDTPEGRQQNRRVEVVLVPNLNELSLPEISGTCGRALDQLAQAR
jgi:chemotaxis protein MotB